LQEHDPERDDPRSKVIELENNKIHLRRTDPYGFIEIHFDKGQLPEHLATGRFTTWEDARKAIDQYLRDKNRLSEVKPNKKVV
jgi:hypothetical protein